LIDADVRSVVFSSSCSVYGIQDRMPIGENSPTSPLSPYAETKLFVEKALHWYASAYRLRYVCLRYFNAAGADPGGELGELHSPETHLIPLAIYAALGGATLRVFGTDYPTPDGTAIRDYTHVADLAEAHVRALRYLIADRPPVTLNLGSGRGYSVKQVIEAVEHEVGTTVPVGYGARRQGDAPMLIADCGNAGRILGWHPEYSSIGNIVRTAWDWHRRYSWSKPLENRRIYDSMAAASY
jgi:UDP-glucose-4-epimerase GalE